MKQKSDASAMRVRAAEELSVVLADWRSAAGRIRVLSTATVDGFAGLCLAQQGCFVPQGMARGLAAIYRTGAIR